MNSITCFSPPFVFAARSLFRSRGRRWLALAGALLAAAAGAGAAPQFMETAIWEKNDGGYVSHFVYGLGVTWDDTLLAACEGRVGGADAAEKDLLIKRSTDHGVTWSDDLVLEGADDHLSWSNPSFVTDGVTTYLFYCLTVDGDHGRVFYRSTTDNGLTWSARTEITQLWANNPHGWTQHGSIGHGIVKLRGPARGRVLVAFHHRGRVALPPAQRGYGNDIIFLGPHGWEIAGGPPPDRSRGTNEARLAERPDGSLYLLARQASGANQLRALSESLDGGKTWSAWTTAADIRGTVCDSGLLRFSDACHLYSYPSGTAKSARERRDLAIKFSRDGGATWAGERLLYRGQSTYSDLARDSRGNIYCLYGRDGSNFMGDRAFMARFNVEWVTGEPAPTIVVDDGDAEFTTTGTWSTDAALPGRFGAGSRRAEEAGATAGWNPRIERAGRYELYLRWPAAREEAQPGGTLELVVGGQDVATAAIDQRRGAGAWSYVGTFSLPAGRDCLIRFRAGAAGALADAVMLQAQ